MLEPEGCVCRLEDGLLLAPCHRALPYAESRKAVGLEFFPFSFHPFFPVLHSGHMPT